MCSSRVINRLEEVYEKCHTTESTIPQYTEEEKIEMKLALYEKAENGEITFDDRDRLLSLL